MTSIFFFFNWQMRKDEGMLQLEDKQVICGSYIAVKNPTQNQNHLLTMQHTSTLNQIVENEDCDTFLPYTGQLTSHAGSVNTISYPALGE